MRRHRFTPNAQAQLAHIWRYSAANWGTRRADAYLRAIRVVVVKAASGAKPMRSCEEYGAGLHSVRSGAHVIFARWDAGGVLEVVGVLHQMMEPALYFSDDPN